MMESPRSRNRRKPQALVATVVTTLVTIALLCPTAVASQFVKGGNVVISKLDHIGDDYYVYAQKFVADGIIDGDLAAFAYQITINGEVSQSANLFGRNVIQSGKINGSLRAFAQSVTLNGFVSRSAILFGQDVIVAKGSIVEKDVNIYGGQVELDGTVKGNVNAHGERVELSGVITGNATIHAEHVVILAPAVITGNLVYTSPNDAQIDTTAGVTISGTITKEKPTIEDNSSKGCCSYTSVILRISSLFAAFVFGIIVVFLFRPYAEESVHQLRTRFSTAIAAGSLGLFGLIATVVVLVLSLALGISGLLLVSGDLAPIGSLLLIFSILLLPATSFLSISGAIIFYCGKIVLGFVLGYLLLQKIKPGISVLSKSALFLGLLILSVLFFIPIVGVLFYFAASVIGLGAILLGIKNCRTSKPEQTQN